MIVRVLTKATPTQHDLAAWAGVSYETVRSWRQKRRFPSPAAMEKLAKGLRRHAAQLLRFAEQLERRAARAPVRRR